MYVVSILRDDFGAAELLFWHVAMPCNYMIINVICVILCVRL